MAKGIKAAPKKRKKKRLTEHARLVEERARSIPPGVVHELFDTSSLPAPPPVPSRQPATAARYVSKPPPPPPRPSRHPAPDENAELTELEELEADAAGDDVAELEESQPNGFGSHTIPPRGAGDQRPSDVAPGARRSRVLPGLLGFAAVGALALATGRELGRSTTAPRRAEAKAASTAPPPAVTQGPHLPPVLPAPVADDLPLLPPGVTAAPSAAPVEDVAEASNGAPPAATAAASVVAVSPDAVSVAAASPVLALPAGPASSRAEMGPFDPAVAEAAITAAFQRARGCRSATDPKGVATATLTYAPSGRVTTALVSGIFAGTPTGSCIAAALRSARIEPFTGALVTVKRSATLE